MQSSFYPGQQVLGNWIIEKSIGAGSFGQVFEVTRKEFDLEYRAALKVITVPQSDAELQAALSQGVRLEEAGQYFHSQVKEIVNEFSLMARVKGVSNVVSYEDHAVIPHEDGIGYDILIRMELLTPLLDYAKEHPFTRRDVMQLGIDMCRALELCQRQNIIHRDIKPDNIFVSANGDFKLGDFGIARTTEKMASGMSKKGTYHYMAPEVYRGMRYGFSVDIYSLGVVLYRLLNQNRVPFMPAPPTRISYADEENALVQRMGGAPMPLPYFSEGRLPEIILKACSFSVADRYSSPRQMREDLESILYDVQDSSVIYPTGDHIAIRENQYVQNAAPSNANTAQNGAQYPAQQPVNNGVAANRVAPQPQPANQWQPQSQPVPTVQPQPQVPPVTIAQPQWQTEPQQGGQQKKTVLAICLVAVLLVGVVGVYSVIAKVRQGAIDTESQAQEQSQAVQQSADEYNELMGEASDLLETDPVQARELYTQAQALQPEEADPYVNYAYATYLMGEYAECTDYIENDLAMGKAYDVDAQSALAEILGASYFEQQDYAAAASFFRLSIAGGDLSASAMRDYAVSLARLGDVDAADEVLASMAQAGATDEETRYVQAEVDYGQGEYLVAQSGLQAVMESSDDINLQVKAMRSLAELYRDCAILERTDQSPIAGAAVLEVTLLENSIAKYGLSYDTVLREMLAFAYFEAYNQDTSLGAECLKNAAESFQQVIDQGIQKEYLYTNLYTIYYQLGDYNQAGQALVAYEAVYPDAYTPHALRATMMIVIENQKDQDSRDYNAAYQEFLVAESKLRSSDDTTYYQQVKSLISTLRAQGWIA